MPKKRRNVEVEMEVDSEAKEEPKSDDAEEDDEMEDLDSPSPPAGKKRRRSAGNAGAGVTPESQIRKKVKPSVNTTGTKAEEKKGDDETPQQQQLLLASSSVHSPQVINGDESALSEASVGAAPLQQQAILTNGGNSALTSLAAVGAPGYSPESSPEAGRKLFGATPSPVATIEATESSMEAAKSPEKAVASPEAIATANSPQVEVRHPTNGHHPEQQQLQQEVIDDDVMVEYHGVLTFFWICFFGGLFLALLPYSVDLADMAVPMNSLRPVNETEIYVELERNLLAELSDYEPQIDVEEEEKEPTPEPEISAAVMEAVRNLQTLQHSLEQSKRGLDTVYSGIERTMATVVGEAIEVEADRAQRLAQISLVESKIALALNDENLSSSAAWKDAIASTDMMTIVDTTLIQLWEISDPVECPAATTVEETVAAIDPNILSPARLDEEYESLLERAYAVSEKLRQDPATELMVREWMRSRIESDINSDIDTIEIIKELTTPVAKTVKSTSSSVNKNGVGGIDAEDVEEIIGYRLEMERADKTGQFDHASLLNGAQVVYGGKRGTSDSLIDSLPLYNRIMQVSKLQFYGYGPEVSIIPTWPPDALGQCWSFQQPPIKDLLKRKRHMGDDDHKRGSYGTLTISLPHPVNVKSVVIEHPPKGLTDNVKSAVRAFRVIGYGDAMATEKSWPLGSFEYDVNSNKPMQEFQVATEIFRTPVPPLQSITLAIDSNWGFDYACLYRFRVHGELEE